jgi:hypothetical protein
MAASAGRIGDPAGRTWLIEVGLHNAILALAAHAKSGTGPDLTYTNQSFA